MKRATPIRIAAVCTLLAVVLVLVSVGALLVGGAGGLVESGDDLSAGAMLRALLGGDDGSPAATILHRIRLPQVLLAATIGAALAVSGAVFQTTLRNPLADPLLLGVASGASLAASIAIGLGARGGLVTSAAATAGAALTLAFVFAIAGRRGRFDPATMVLAGVIASTFYSAVTLFLLAITPSETISSILHWTMGDFVDVGFRKVRWAGPVLGVLILATMPGARALNLLLLGDDSAKSAGLPVEAARAVLYAVGAALTGVSVAAAGVIGFVGLVVPHIARALFGPDQRVALPASALLGATLCVLADAVARVAVPLAQIGWAAARGVAPRVAPVELPVGVVTALFGAPFFLFLLVRRPPRRLT